MPTTQNPVTPDDTCKDYKKPPEQVKNMFLLCLVFILYKLKTSLELSYTLYIISSMFCSCTELAHRVRITYINLTLIVVIWCSRITEPAHRNRIERTPPGAVAWLSARNRAGKKRSSRFPIDISRSPTVMQIVQR